MRNGPSGRGVAALMAATAICLVLDGAAWAQQAAPAAADIKQHDNHGSTGQVIRLFREQSYGFVEVRGAPDLYFTRNAVVGGDFDDLELGTLVHVTVATTEGPMGPQASSVRLLDATRSVA